MKKELLEQMVNDNKSFNTIAKETGKSLTTIRYWCKKHNIKSKFKTFSEEPFNPSNQYGDLRYCPRCGKDCHIEEFYSRRGKSHSSVYCKTCTNEQTIERIQSIKKQMVKYKGDKCSKCGYDTYIGALEFHHLDPTQKDFNLSRLKKNKFDEKIKNELDKCILVCSNCHREIHHELRLDKNK